MTATAPSPIIPPSSGPADDDRYYRDAMHTFIEVGTKLVQDLADQATPAATKAEPYERFSRAARRSILLARHIAKHPLKAATAAPDQRRAAARARLVREVEDRIETKAESSEHAETLRAELRERLDDLDSPDALDDILDRPLSEQAEEIRRDLGIADLPYGVRYKRRTPSEIRALRDFAQQPGPSPQPQPQSHRLQVVRDG